MKRKAWTTLVVALFLGVFLYYSYQQIQPDQIENAPDWLPLQDALVLAEETDTDNQKLLLIDIYESGCRFCRQMEREVYPSESIRTLIDRSFHPVKVNGNSDESVRYQGETMTGREFASLMGVTAFPYTVVMNAEGDVIDNRRGYMGVSDLSRFLNQALREQNNS